MSAGAQRAAIDVALAEVDELRAALGRAATAALKISLAMSNVGEGGSSEQLSQAVVKFLLVIESVDLAQGYAARGTELARAYQSQL
jgi:hypothetical protein